MVCSNCKPNSWLLVCRNDMNWIRIRTAEIRRRKLITRHSWLSMLMMLEKLPEQICHWKCSFSARYSDKHAWCPAMNWLTTMNVALKCQPTALLQVPVPHYTIFTSHSFTIASLPTASHLCFPLRHTRNRGTTNKHSSIDIMSTQPKTIFLIRHGPKQSNSETVYPLDQPCTTR